MVSSPGKSSSGEGAGGIDGRTKERSDRFMGVPSPRWGVSGGDDCCRVLVVVSASCFSRSKPSFDLCPARREKPESSVCTDSFFPPAANGHPPPGASAGSAPADAGSTCRPIPMGGLFKEVFKDLGALLNEPFGDRSIVHSSALG